LGDAGIDVDLSQGAGCHVKNGKIMSGIPNKTSSKLRATFEGYFEDTRVFEAPLTDSDHIAGVTLPGKGIIVSEGVYVERFMDPQFMDLLKHEYGHILQAKAWGRFAFYDIIGHESLYSATFHPDSHSTFWTETHANYHTQNYFDGPSGMWLDGFNSIDYPVAGLSHQNYLRLSTSQYIGKLLGMD